MSLKIAIPILSEEPITGAIVVDETSGAAKGPEPTARPDPNLTREHGIKTDDRGFPTAEGMREYHKRVNAIE